MGQLKSAVAETSSGLQELDKKQRMVTRFKGLSGQLDATKQKLAGAKAETKRLQQAETSAVQVVKQHTAALKVAEQTVLEAAQAYGAESDQVVAARKEVTRLTSAKKASETALKKERAAIKTAEQSAARLTSTYSKQSQELGGLRRDMGAAGLKLNALGAEELRLAKKTGQANKALEQQAAKLKKVQSIQGRIEARTPKRVSWLVRLLVLRLKLLR